MHVNVTVGSHRGKSIKGQVNPSDSTHNIPMFCGEARSIKVNCTNTASRSLVAFTQGSGYVSQKLGFIDDKIDFNRLFHFPPQIVIMAFSLWDTEWIQQCKWETGPVFNLKLTQREVLLYNYIYIYSICTVILLYLLNNYQNWFTGDSLRSLLFHLWSIYPLLLAWEWEYCLKLKCALF